MKNNVFLFIFLLLIFVFVMAVVLTPTPIDWNFSYSRYDKNPHGSFLLYEELDKVFPEAEIETTDSTVFQVTKAWEKDSTALIIISQFFNPYEYQSNPLDSFVFNGNNVFISANNLTFNRSDTSEMGYHRIFTKNFNDDFNYYYNNNKKEKNKLVEAQFFNSTDTTRYKIRKEYGYRTIGTDSTLHYKLGSLLEKDADSAAINLIRIKHGKGNFYIHSNPGVFTNNAMLHDSLANYATSVLSHMENVKYVLWDEHQKPGFMFFDRTGNRGTTPWAFIKSNKALHLAYLVALWGCILLVFTKFKREQQAIPIIKPPKNSSVEFAETMGRFYHENGDNLDIARKRMRYFEVDVRNAYNIHDLDEYKNKKKELSRIIGVEEKVINNLYQKRELITKVNKLSEGQLIRVSKSIEDMKIKV